MKTRAKITKQDWLKLEGWTDSLAVKVEQNIRPGYYDRDDVKSELRLSFAKLMSTWRPGPLDVTSYVWKWAAKLTALRLNREIASIVYDLAEELDPDEEPRKDFRGRPSPEERRTSRELAGELYD